MSDEMLGPQRRSTPRVPASSEPRPENPHGRDEAVNPYRLAREVENDALARMTGPSPREEAWDEGRESMRAAFDAVVAERDEAIEAVKVAAVHHVEKMRELRAERDAAITAGQKLADLVTLLGGYDGPGYLAAPNQGERPDYVAAARLFSKIMRDETNGAAAALAAWRSVSGSSEPR